MTLLGGLAAAPLLTGFMGAPAWADRAAPPGNNGTVKVDGQPFDSGHDNEPHPGCSFRITFFGFDAGTNTADVTFDAHPPTGTGQLLHSQFRFTDTRDQGGATFDGGSPAYDLTAALAQFGSSAQGYHVKLSVSVDGGNPKHKVFWVGNCTNSGAAASEETRSAQVHRLAAGHITAPSVTGPALTPASPSAAAPVELESGAAPTASAAPAVLGVELSRSAPAASSSTATRARTLAFTGFNLLVGLAAAAGLIAAGACALLVAPRVGR